MNDHDARDVLDEATRALWDTPVPDGPPAELVAATVATITNRPGGSVPAGRTRRRRIMRYFGYGAATAAAVAVATAAGLLWFGGGSAAALQKAIEKARKAESVRYTSTLAVEGVPDKVELARVRGDRFRIEAADGSQVRIADLKARKGVILDADRKLAQQLDLPAGPEAQPSILDALNKLAGQPGERVGEEDVGGVRATRFKVTIGGPKDARQEWAVWVDPKTGWPVKMQSAGTVAVPQDDGTDKEVPFTSTLDRLEWNAPFDDTLFALDPPEGYRPVKGIAPPFADPPADPPHRAAVARAVENARRAKSVRLVWTREYEGKAEPLMTVHIQDGRSRWEGRTRDKDLTLLVDLAARQGLRLNHVAKTAEREALTGDRLTDARKQHEVFFKPLDVLRDTKDMTVKELDGEKLDGRPMKVFMLSHPGNDEHGAMTAVLWIDKKTDLPARLKLLDDALATKDPSGPKADTVIAFEDWNKAFDAKLFKLDVPEGYKLLTDTPAPVVELPVVLLRQAAEKAAKAKSFRYVALYIPLDGPASLPRRVTNWYRGPLQRMEALDTDQPQIILCDWARKRVLQLDTAAKTATWEPVTDAEAADARRWVAELPRLVTDQFKGNPDYELTELPREVVNGRPARVLEARRKPGAKPAGPGNDNVVELSVVWIDAETGLPARFRTRKKEPAVEVVGLFDQWDEEFDPKLFSLDVPAGYKLVGTDKKD